MTPDLWTAMSSLVSLGLLWYLAMWLYRGYRVDHYRNELFALRNDLFDMARAGRIPFDHEAYTTMRSTYNGYIRFADRLSLSAVFLFSIGLTAEESAFLFEEGSFQKRFDRMTNGLRADVVQDLRLQKTRMHNLLATQLVLGSPFLVATVLTPAIMFAVMKFQLAAFARLRKRLQRAIADRADEVALTAGEFASAG